MRSTNNVTAVARNPAFRGTVLWGLNTILMKVVGLLAWLLQKVYCGKADQLFMMMIKSGAFAMKSLCLGNTMPARDAGDFLSDIFIGLDY